MVKETDSQRGLRKGGFLGCGPVETDRVGAGWGRRVLGRETAFTNALREDGNVYIFPEF